MDVSYTMRSRVVNLCYIEHFDLSFCARFVVLLGTSFSSVKAKHMVKPTFLLSPYWWPNLCFVHDTLHVWWQNHGFIIMKSTKHTYKPHSKQVVAVWASLCTTAITPGDERATRCPS